jgi:hypothetical protein
MGGNWQYLLIPARTKSSFFRVGVTGRYQALLCVTGLGRAKRGEFVAQLLGFFRADGGNG